jgi:predicted ATPase with chaperone activity
MQLASRGANGSSIYNNGSGATMETGPKASRPLATPPPPVEFRDLGVEGSVISDLALKLAATVQQLTTAWAAQQLHLPLAIVTELLENLRENSLLEVLGESGLLGYRYSATQRGREHAARLFEHSGYVGPAPVSLEAYTSRISSQLESFPPIGPADVAKAVSDLVLTDEQVTFAGLAVSSGRSLFLYGPPGNGKTSLGTRLHASLRGDLWIPHCITVGNRVIRVYDTQCHKLATDTTQDSGPHDQRWVKIRRPCIIAGGEMTLESVDLALNPAGRYYEAPIQLKANGGLLLVDDFGRQRFDSHELLNRWIVPLEHHVDYLTLDTGQKIQVPFRQILVISTNLDPEKTMDAAFMRRMGYRLHMSGPTPEQFAKIFQDCATRAGFEVGPELIDHLLDRYRTEGRPLRCSEPGDLVKRVGDVYRFAGVSEALDVEILDLAWAGYFGRQ